MRLGRAAVPFSVRLLPGALRLAPERLEWVPPPLSFCNPYYMTNEYSLTFVFAAS